jgi:HK97 gp10 family phage protein
MEINIRVEGLAELAARWRKLPKIVQDKTMAVLTKSGFLVEGESKRRTPVDTDRLRSSISVAQSLALRATPHVVISPHTNYAMYVHEGTRRMKGRPFMSEGYAASKARIRAYMKTLLSEVVKSMK